MRFFRVLMILLVGITATIPVLTPEPADAAGIVLPDPFQPLDSGAFPDAQVDPHASANGCGSQGADGIDVPDEWLEVSFTPACNWHDRCYGTKGLGKEYCDAGMASKAREACAGSSSQERCNGMAGVYWLAVAAFGEQPYLDGQEAGCNRRPVNNGRAHGDPHLVTLDGLSYDFMAAGEYALIRDADSGEDLLQARLNPRTEFFSVVTGFAMPSGDHTIVVDVDPEGDTVVATVDGHPVPGTLGVFDGGYVVLAGDTPGAIGTVSVRTADGLRVDGVVYPGRIDLTVQAPRAFPRQIVGLLGNGNGDPSDDLTIDDEVVQLGSVHEARFKDHWRVAPDDSWFEPGDFDYHAPELAAYPTEEPAFDFAGALGATARGLCETGGLDGDELEACIYDVVASGDESYATSSVISSTRARTIGDPASLRVEPDPALVLAAASGDVDEVDRLLDEGARINIGRAGDRATALIVSAEAGHVDVVERLLARGAAVDLIRDDHSTALVAAALAAQTDIVERLLDAGAFPNSMTEDGNSALSFAALHGDIALVRLLLDAGADPDPMAHTLSTDALPPLTVAAMSRDVDTVRLLLDAGADPNRSTSVFDPLTVAVSGGPLELIELLLDAGANPDGSGQTHPLASAAAASDEEVVELLLAKGADIDRIPDDGFSALSLAAAAGNLAMVELLIELGADVDLQAPSTGWTALHGAALSGFRPVVEALLDAGASPRLTDSTGLTPADLAFVPEIRELLES